MFRKIIFIVCILQLSCILKADEIPPVLSSSKGPDPPAPVDSTSTEAASLSSSASPQPETILSTSLKPTVPPSSTPTPAIQPVTINICNMSLITSEEKEEAVYKKCICDGLHGEVDCSHLGITELPKLISFPKDVHIANMQGNKIANLNSDTFYNAREIIELDLSYNRIDFISIIAFKAFKKLVRLDLSHNNVWNLPKGMFEGLGNLRRLDLSYNDMMNVFPEHFSKLAELRELVLKSNPLQELEPKHFEHLAKLETLDLGATLLKVLPDHVFHFTPRLKTLKLANNQLTDVPSRALQVLDHLKVLDLSNNPIEVIHQEAFLGMSGLIILYLDQMGSLAHIESYAFGDMPHLQELHCSYNFKLSKISEYAFVKKSNNEKVQLSQLFLRENQLSAIPHSLSDWNSGLEMHLRNNPFHCDCHIDWMVNLKLKNNFQDHVRCSSPSEVANLALSDLKGHRLTCGLQLSDIIMIVCGVFTGFLILALLISFLVWRRNYRGYTKPQFYNVKRRNVNDIDYNGGDDGI